MSEERLNFQAEVSRLLDIVANSLYSNKEIFLRELISNASDACDRLRYLALTQPELAGDAEFEIRLGVETKARRLIIRDNGIGMNRAELVENLGTIARSGTAAFVEQLEEKPEDVSLIGKFGVGFYSAFMVAERVEVRTRKAGEREGWLWSSDGKGEFAVTPCDDAPERGTEITLFLRKGEAEFLETARLREIVKTYSDHIAVPIVLTEGAAGAAAEATRINAASALWSRAKSEIADEQYEEFYHHVAHAFDKPWTRLHFTAEGVIQYTGLLYIPSSRPFDLFHPDRRHGVKLYVRRVFITDNCAELVPAYLRFLQGVVDSEDLSLNLSREMLQRDPLVAKIRKGLVNRVLAELKKKAEKAPEDYVGFWRNFGAVLKEGLYEDDGQRDKLLALARFSSSRGSGDELISLDDYIGRMKPGQEAIYYITGAKVDAIAKSPQLEGFVSKGVEVLLLDDPVDEFWIPTIGQYKDKPFKSVTRGGADLAGLGKDEDEKTAEAEDAPEPAEEGAKEIDSLVAFVKLVLGDEIKDARASERLTSSAVCLVADEGDMDMNLERLLKQHHQFDGTSKRILEINPAHPLVRRLAGELGRGSGDEARAALEDAARLLLDQARIVEGEPLPDPAAFARRLSALVARGFAAAD